MKGTTIIILLMTVMSQSIAQVPRIGKCPNKQVVQDFNVKEYLGKWFEQEKYFFIFELGGECVTATYTANDDGTVGVLNENTGILTKRNSSISGSAKLVGSDGEAKLEVRFPQQGNIPAPYWVLYTDYVNYSIVWSCVEVLNISHLEFAWVLTREKNPGADTMEKINEKIKEAGLSQGQFLKTKQTC